MNYKLGAFLLFFGAAMQPVVAQLPSGSIAPDFTVEDINGQTHHLYDVLEDNKIVLLEISATWCPPCWAYHQSQALQDFYAAHGPEGDNTVEVFWVEGDANTNQACIFGQAGCNDASAGNFSEGTAYPILNSASIANAYQITYFPSIFVICPNKRVYEVDPISAEGLWEKAQVCPVAFGANNAGIFAHDPGYDLPEICGSVWMEPSFLLTNLGTEALTSANIFLEWNNDNVQTINWEGNLPKFGEALIQFDSFIVNTGGSMNTVITSINNNAGDEDFTNNYKNNNFTVSQHFDQTRVVLKIRTDNYAKETYWELRDELGAVLEHGGNQLVGPNGGGAFPLGVDAGPGTYSNNTLIKDTLDLPGAGCYSIHFMDAYGDGMCCDYGNGYFKLYNINNPATPLISSGQFEDYDRHAFAAGTVSESTQVSSHNYDIQVFPNPARDFIYIEVDSRIIPALDAQVLNVFGQLVLEGDSVHRLEHDLMEVPLEGLTNGFYFLSITLAKGERPVLKKFVVQR